MLGIDDLREAAAQAWPPFVLVAGLLMVGVAANAAGLFERAGALLGRLPGPPVVVLGCCMALVAGVTATMNLDTAVVFLTPVLILVARRRSLDERPFLYAALFMANASSLFLPGANLTNLLVLGEEPIGGGAFARAMAAPAITAALVTAVGLWLLMRPRPTAAKEPSEPSSGFAPRHGPATPLATWAAGLGVVAAGILTIGLHEPALPVLAAGVVVALVARQQRAITVGEIVRAVGPKVLVPLFAFCVVLGAVARNWSGPANLLAGAGVWETAALAALASVGLNNLPAAVLLSAQAVEHPRALLIGLNLGPNLAVTGSLSSYLWWRAAKQVGAQPSVVQVSKLGVLLAPAAITAATLTLVL